MVRKKRRRVRKVDKGMQRETGEKVECEKHLRGRRDRDRKAQQLGWHLNEMIKYTMQQHSSTVIYIMAVSIGHCRHT